jgi:hypothetical protein
MRRFVRWPPCGNCGNFSIRLLNPEPIITLLPWVSGFKPLNQKQEHVMKTEAKAQVNLFCQASSEWIQFVIATNNKPEVLEILALLLSQLISEQPHQYHEEVNHAR